VWWYSVLGLLSRYEETFVVTSKDAPDESPIILPPFTLPDALEATVRMAGLFRGLQFKEKLRWFERTTRFFV
jgi:hypothetical protein